MLQSFPSTNPDRRIKFQALPNEIQKKFIVSWNLGPQIQSLGSVYLIKRLIFCSVNRLAFIVAKLLPYIII